MDFIQKLWNRLPWFKLRTKDGDWISGKMHPDKSVELTVETQWGNVLVLVGAEEGLRLRDWLVKAYHNPESADGLAAVLPIRKPKRDPGPSPEGAG
jgi:hypothetical protein